VVDRDRVLGKVDELDGYLRELRSIAPATLEEYRTVEKKRACERLLQIAIEAVVDVCALLVTGLRLGVPSEENDVFDKLARAGAISVERATVLHRMKGFSNLLVHEYVRIDDRIVFETLRDRLGDFDEFRREILATIRTL
jgi:uncharacterized protein YutE (UPF0331/DUF86 family)